MRVGMPLMIANPGYFNYWKGSAGDIAAPLEIDSEFRFPVVVV
jgi:hypothetical protein